MIANKFDKEKTIGRVRGAVIPHNFLIGEPAEEEWITNTGTEDDLDPEPAAAMSSCKSDCRRRQELLFCLGEPEDTPIDQTETLENAGRLSLLCKFHLPVASFMLPVASPSHQWKAEPFLCLPFHFSLASTSPT